MREQILACVFGLVCSCGVSAQVAGGPAQPAMSTVTQSPEAEAELSEATQLSQSVVKLFSERKFDEALPRAERVLALREKWLKPGDVKVADALFNLAALYEGKGKFDKAEPLYLRALPIYEQGPGASAQRLAGVLYALSVIRYRKSSYSQSATYLERAIALLEKLHGRESLEVADMQLGLAEIYLVKGDYKQATPLLQSAIEVWRKKLDPDDPKLEQYHDRVTCMVITSGHHEDMSKMFTPPEPPPGGATASNGVLNGKAIEKPQPSYPQAAKAAHISGTVVVKIVVDETGKVIKANTLCGPQELAGASEEAARKARFTPTLLSGQPVKVSGIITYSYVLSY